MTQAPEAPDAPESALAAARSALERHEWQSALDIVTGADERRELKPDGLLLLGTAGMVIVLPSRIVRRMFMIGHVRNHCCDVARDELCRAIPAYWKFQIRAKV